MDQIQIPRGMAEYARQFIGQRRPRQSRGAMRTAIEAMIAAAARHDGDADGTPVRWTPPPPLHGLEQFSVASTPGRLELSAQRDDFDGASTSFTVGLDTAYWQVVLVSMVGPRAQPGRDSFDPIDYMAENDLQRRRQYVCWGFRRDGRECELRAFRKLQPGAPWRAELRVLDGGHVEPLDGDALRLVTPADTFASPRHAFDVLVSRLPVGHAPATGRRPESRLV